MSEQQCNTKKCMCTFPKNIPSDIALDMRVKNMIKSAEVK